MRISRGQLTATEYVLNIIFLQIFIKIQKFKDSLREKVNCLFYEN